MTLRYERVNLVSDSRGTVFEPIKPEDISGKKNCHVVISLPGVVRGNHYHEKGEETIAVMGPALVRFRENGTIRDVNIGKEEISRFIFPPGISHAIKNTGEESNILVAFNTQEHDPRNPDTVRDVLI